MHRIYAGLFWLAMLYAISGSASAAPLKVGFGTHKPPYVYENEPLGLEFELVKAAAEAAGLRIEPYYAPMERLHLLLGRGQLDAITATNPSSGVPAHYSDAYIEYGNVAITLAKREITLERIADLSAYSVSAFQRARYLLGEEFGQMAMNNDRYREEARQLSRNLLLYAGRVEVVIAEPRIFRAFNAEIADRVDVTQAVAIHALFEPMAYSVGFIDPLMRDRFNQGLGRLRESGEYRRIERQYDDF